MAVDSFNVEFTYPWKRLYVSQVLLHRGERIHPHLEWKWFLDQQVFYINPHEQKCNSWGLCAVLSPDILHEQLIRTHLLPDVLEINEGACVMLQTWHKFKSYLSKAACNFCGQMAYIYTNCTKYEKTYALVAAKRPTSAKACISTAIGEDKVWSLTLSLVSVTSKDEQL